MQRKLPKDKVRSMSLGAQVEYINRKLGYGTLIRPPKYWLDTGSPELNRVLGSEKLGLAYGMLYLIAGETSAGKSALAAMLAGLGQQDEADVAWVDGENSFDGKHVKRQGLDAGHRIRNKDGDVIGYTKVALFRPEYGRFVSKKKKKKQRENVLNLEDVESAERLFTRVETWMKLRRKLNPKGKLIVVVDSTNSFSPEEELIAGIDEQNMRTRSSPAVFLNTVTKRWVNLALHTNAIVLLISQLRDNPGKMFGNPKYVSGGNGIQYYSQSVSWMRRVQDGEIKRHGEQIGARGLISNRKNKVGGGSVERKRCGYLGYFFERKSWKFSKVKKKHKGEDNG